FESGIVIEVATKKGGRRGLVSVHLSEGCQGGIDIQHSLAEWEVLAIVAMGFGVEVRGTMSSVLPIGVAGFLV
ncbi:unnamed protein product, partial [marine sediment metagenome]